MADMRGRGRTRPARAARSARRTRRTAMPPRRPETALRRSSRRLPGDNADVGDEGLAEEQHPREPGDRPGDEDVRHRQLGELRVLVPAELNELEAVPDEDQREREDERARPNAQQCVRPRLQLGPHVDLEMRAFADPDHGAEHDHPDEEKTRHLLGPDVGRDELGVARDDLQRHRHDQDRHRGDEQPGQEPVVELDEFAHGILGGARGSPGLRPPVSSETWPTTGGPLRAHRSRVEVYLIALIRARIWSAPISVAYAAITGSTAFFIWSRSANGMRLSFPAFSSASSLAASSLDSTCRPYAPASLPALTTASCRSFGSRRNVLPEKQTGRMVIACSVMLRLGPTS